MSGVGWYRQGLFFGTMALLAEACALDDRQLYVGTASEQPGVVRGTGGQAGNGAAPGSSPAEGEPARGFVPSDVGSPPPSSGEAPPPPENSSRLTANSLIGFGGVEVGVSGPTRIWHIVNEASTDTGPLTASSSLAEEFEIAGACPSLAPGAACDLMVSFKPGTGGTRSASLDVVGSDGTIATATASGRGLYRLTLTKSGQGTVYGVVVPELNCGASCTALFDAGRRLQLEALPSNGSDAIFTGWSGGGCPAAPGPCSVVLEASQSIHATFSTLTNNLAFVTSSNLPGNLGGAAQYDARCNALATASGVNVAGLEGFIAMLSDSQSTFQERLGSARGWVRMDGRPVFDTIGDLLDNATIYYPVRFTERGIDSYAESGRPGAVWTGTNFDGSAADFSCNDWTLNDPTTVSVV
ncbi:MAG TPA: hypothetical protein VNN80_20960, partial [Polyangiaceae bacterium]|nr:hypothetical protein [Polyangiaceae bacterium]